MITELFINRRQAGRILGSRLLQFRNREDVVVLALPRGGVPVAFEVARALGAPLDVLAVRKLGTPEEPELAMGAIARETTVLNRSLIRALGISRSDVDTVLATERDELRRREQVYRGERVPVSLVGRTVLLVDDGLATGATMTAAIAAVMRQHAAAVVVAVPVASREAVAHLLATGAAVVAVSTPEPFGGVGRWYEDFGPASDAEVVTLLAAGWKRPRSARLTGERGGPRGAAPDALRLSQRHADPRLLT